MITAGDKLRMKGKRDLFKRLVKGNFDQTNDELMNLIDKVDIKKIEKLSDRIFKIKDVQELEYYLKQ